MANNNGDNIGKGIDRYSKGFGGFGSNPIMAMAQKKGAVIISSKENDKSVQSDKNVKSVNDVKPAQEVKSVKSTQNVKSVNDVKKEQGINTAQSVQNSEKVQSVQTVKDTQSMQSVNNVKVEKNINTVHEVNNVNDVQGVHEEQEVQKTQSVKNMQSINKDNKVHNVQDVQNIKDVKQTKGNKADKSIKNVQNIKSVQSVNNIQSVNVSDKKADGKRMNIALDKDVETYLYEIIYFHIHENITMTGYVTRLVENEMNGKSLLEGYVSQKKTRKRKESTEDEKRKFAFWMSPKVLDFITCQLNEKRIKIPEYINALLRADMKRFLKDAKKMDDLTPGQKKCIEAIENASRG